MKKIFLSILAIAALASCAKTEPTFEQPGEISFSPVSKYNTKAAVTDQSIGGQDFYVFANTVEPNVKYFENVLFSKEGTTTSTNGYQVYKATPAQYWPNVETLKFAGYTASGNATGNAEMNSEFTSMTITNYTQPHTFITTSESNDFMWFFDYGADNAGYGKGTTYVEPTMKHALSWITIKVKVDSKLTEDRDITTDGVQSYWSNITVDNLKFENIKTTGKVVLTSTDATWSEQNGVQTSVNIYDKGTGAGISVGYSEPTTIEPTDVTNNVIVIPQTPTTLSMTYTYTSPASASVTETKTGISLDYNNSADWVAGMHYTYELTISADEIKIAPMSAKWTNHGATDSNETGASINGII